VDRRAFTGTLAAVAVGSTWIGPRQKSLGPVYPAWRRAMPRVDTLYEIPSTAGMNGADRAPNYDDSNAQNPIDSYSGLCSRQSPPTFFTTIARGHGGIGNNFGWCNNMSKHCCPK
jgi:hypothetical protein